MLRLPDGSTVTSTVGGDTGGSKVSLTESQSPSHGRLPLPTITEQVRMIAGEKYITKLAFITFVEVWLLFHLENECFTYRLFNLVK